MPIIFLRAPIHGWPCRPIGQQVRGHDPRTPHTTHPKIRRPLVRSSATEHLIVPRVPPMNALLPTAKCVASAAQSKVRPPALRQYPRYSPQKSPRFICVQQHINVTALPLKCRSKATPMFHPTGKKHQSRMCANRSRHRPVYAVDVKGLSPHHARASFRKGDPHTETALAAPNQMHEVLAKHVYRRTGKAHGCC